MTCWQRHSIGVVQFLAVLALTQLTGHAQQPVNAGPPNAPWQSPAFEGQTRAPEEASGVEFEVQTIASGLENPWGMAFLPERRILVTERAGRMRIVTASGTVSDPLSGLPAVDARGQGGLLDVALDPMFALNRLVYWSYAEPRRGGQNGTTVARGRFVDGLNPRFEQVRVIYRQEPSMPSTMHYGGRLAWATDGTLLITQGERSDLDGRMQAQRMDSLLGKIVRINPDGSVPRSNPFVGQRGSRSEIWSIGHRNVEAAAINPVTGDLWEVEHGARGGDELNVVRRGLDYGWPTITYGIEYDGRPIGDGIQVQPGMEQPLYYWDPVIAPSGMTFYTSELFPQWKGSLFVGGLASQALVRLSIEGERVVGEERLLTDGVTNSGRIRDVRQGPDGALYLLTDDSHGRLLKIVPR